MWSVTHKNLKSGGGVCPALASRKKKRSEQTRDAHIRSTSAITKFCISLHVFLSPFTLKASCLTSLNGVYLDGLLTIDSDLLLHSQRTENWEMLNYFSKAKIDLHFWQWHSFPVKPSDLSTVVHFKASFKRSSWAAKYNENCSFMLQCYLHGIQQMLVFHGIPFSTEKDCSVNEKNSREKAWCDKSALNNYGYKISSFKRLFLGR